MKVLQDLPSIGLSDRAYLPPASGVYLAATADQLLYVGMTSAGIELLRQKAQLSGLSMADFLECAARGIEPSPENIRVYVEGRKQIFRP